MKDWQKALLVVLLIGAGYMYFTGGIPQLGQVGGPEGALTPEQAKAQCPDEDGKTDAKFAYSVQAPLEEAGAEITDLRVFDGHNAQILSVADETSSSYATYNTSTNQFSCTGGPYSVYLGDETEEYMRLLTVSAGGTPDLLSDPVYIEAKGGQIASTITFNGYENGAVESTWNTTIGSGGSTGALDLDVIVGEADKMLEAKDGLLIVAGLNDTCYDQTKWKFGAKALVACPPCAKSLVSKDDTSLGAVVCFNTEVTQILEWQELSDFTATQLYIVASTAIDPAGDGLNDIDFNILGENYYYNSNTQQMAYGYCDENDAKLQPSITAKVLYVI